MDYAAVQRGVDRLVAGGQRDCVANAANAAALVYRALRDARGEEGANWVGFYFVRPVRGTERRVLFLGPFHGKPAVVRIPYGRGVCGTVARTGELRLVPDVHAEPNHITCDPASRSEVVLPVRDAGGRLVAVLDLDCPRAGGFGEADAAGLAAVADAVGRGSDWPLGSVPVDDVPGEEDEDVVCAMRAH